MLKQKSSSSSRRKVANNNNNNGSSPRANNNNNNKTVAIASPKDNNNNNNNMRDTTTQHDVINGNGNGNRHRQQQRQQQQQQYDETTTTNNFQMIREHRVIVQRSCNSSSSNSIMGGVTSTKQHVIIPSAKQTLLLKRKRRVSWMRKYVVLLLGIVGLVALANVTDDLSASLSMSRHNSAISLWMHHDYGNMTIKLDAPKINFGELVQEVDNWCLEPDHGIGGIGIGGSSATTEAYAIGNDDDNNNNTTTTTTTSSSTSMTSGFASFLRSTTTTTTSSSSDCTTCQDPTIPTHRKHLSQWKRAYLMNLKQQRKKQQKGDISSSSDIIFLGDSITEGWRGTSYGSKIARTEGISKVFKQYFPNAMAMGISGDTCSNLLWRIQHGEVITGGQQGNVLRDGSTLAQPTTTTTTTNSTSQPKLIVLLIGTNDLGNHFCSPELVVLGILNIVQELHTKLNDTTILIHGLLPRTFDRKGNVLKGKRTPWILGGGWMTSTTTTTSQQQYHPSTIQMKQQQYQHRQMKRHYRKSALPSLWNDINEINIQLKRFVITQNTTKIQYYHIPIQTWMNNNNSTTTTKSTSTKKKKMNENEQRQHSFILNSTLMPDYLHPSKLGYEIWAKELKKEIERILLLEEEEEG